MRALPVGRFAGISETLHFDDGEDTFSLLRSEDVEPVIDANKAAQADGDGYSPTREMRHLARIPMVVYLEWNRQFGVDVMKPEHRGLLKHLLNDPDNKFLRVSEGAV